MNFSEKLLELRRVNDLTQEQLAEQLEVSRQSVSKWESGVSIPELTKLIAIADLFDVSLDYLVRDRMPMESEAGVGGWSDGRSGLFDEPGQESGAGEWPASHAPGDGKWSSGRESGAGEWPTGRASGGGKREAGQAAGFTDKDDKYNNKTAADMERLEKKLDRMERELHGYEYISKKTFHGVPLVCVRFFPRRGLVPAAKGIIAVGNLAVGVVAAGGISVGVISFGMIGLGLLALGGVAAGVLAFGGVAIGALAVGASAVGVVAIGASSLGVYCYGAAAVGSEIAVGDHVAGNTVVGLECDGEHILQYYPGMTRETVRAFLLEYHPSLPKPLLELFSWLGSNIR